MSVRNRTEWPTHIERIIRSKHYTWLAEGLGGAPLERALVDITADIMHICEHEGISWESIAARGQSQFEQEEAEAADVAAASKS